MLTPFLRFFTQQVNVILTIIFKMLVYALKFKMQIGKIFLWDKKDSMMAICFTNSLKVLFGPFASWS